MFDVEKQPQPQPLPVQQQQQQQHHQPPSQEQTELPPIAATPFVRAETPPTKPKSKVAVICIIAAVAVLAVVLVLFLGTDIFSRADRPLMTLDEPTPAQPAEIRAAATTIVAGVDVSFVIRHDGSLWAWGRNNYGQLGDGTTTDRHSPVWIMDDVIAVDVGGSHTMAIRSDGSLWAWGSNSHGQLGDGTTTDRHDPAWIMDDVIAVACGRRHTMAIRSDGSLWAWGSNDFGLLGDGTRTIRDWDSYPYRIIEDNDRHSPVWIMDDVIAVDASTHRTMAIRSDGRLWAWGRNDFGELGDASMNNRDVIVYVPRWIIDDVIAVDVGGGHTMAIRSDGSLWAWGVNWYGQLGDGTATIWHYLAGFYRMITENNNRRRPVWIMDDVIAVACGGSHTMAIRSDGSLWAWGGNSRGQLGDGTATISYWDRALQTRTITEDNDRHVPVWIMDDVIAVACGGSHTMVIRSDGGLWAWGSNNFGQLGDGTTTDRHSPVWIIE